MSISFNFLKSWLHALSTLKTEPHAWFVRFQYHFGTALITFKKIGKGLAIRLLRRFKDCGRF